MEDKVLCCCFNVTLNDVKKAINEGVKTFEGLQNTTQIGTECAPCEEKNRTLFQELIKEHS